MGNALYYIIGKLIHYQVLLHFQWTQVQIFITLSGLLHYREFITLSGSKAPVNVEFTISISDFFSNYYNHSIIA